MILALLFALSAPVDVDDLAPATRAERVIVEAVLDGCPTASRRHVDPNEVLALVRLEVALGVPREARGVLSAWRCIESAFRPASRLYGDAGRALGPMQLHDVLAHWCSRGGDWRGDLVFSGRCVVAHIMRLHERARARCGEAAAWRVAEAMTSNAARYRWRCDAQSKHWRLAAAWRARQ